MTNKRSKFPLQRVEKKCLISLVWDENKFGKGGVYIEFGKACWKGSSRKLADFLAWGGLVKVPRGASTLSTQKGGLPAERTRLSSVTGGGDATGRKRRFTGFAYHGSDERGKKSPTHSLVRSGKKGAPPSLGNVRAYLPLDGGGYISGEGKTTEKEKLDHRSFADRHP